MSSVGRAVRKDVEKLGTIWITGSGFADVAISKRYFIPYFKSKYDYSVQIVAKSCQQGRQIEEDPDDYNKRGTVHRIKKAAVEKIQRSKFSSLITNS